MSEHSRYQSDRSASRDHRDRIDSERRHRETYAVQDHNRETSHNNDVWNSRHTDRDATYRSESHYRDQHGLDAGRIDPSFSSYSAEDEERNHTHRQNPSMRPEESYEQSYEQSYESTRDTAPMEQDVWLREKQSRITFNDSDLQDFQFTERSERVRKLAAYSGVVAMIGLIVFLGFSSTPDLSPLEIIAADGYEGEQPTKTPFNLASLRNCQPGTECANALKSTVTPIVSAPAVLPSATIFDQTTTATVPDTFIEANDAELLTDGSFDTIQILEIAATDSGLATTTLRSRNSEAGLYDRLTVLQQWSNVRGTPDINGDILVSLAIGKSVTKLGETGPWIEVRVDERPSVTGYMHRSTIAAQ